MVDGVDSGTSAAKAFGRLIATLLVGLLGLLGCAGPTTPRASSWTEGDVAIVLTLQRVLGEEASYCLRVLGRRPSAPLRERLRSVGHRMIRCSDEVVEFRVTAVRQTHEDVFVVDVYEHCGAVCGYGTRTYIRRNEGGTLALESSELTLEM